MAMNEYSTFSRTPVLELHYPMQFREKHKTPSLIEIPFQFITCAFHEPLFLILVLQQNVALLYSKSMELLDGISDFNFCVIQYI